MPVIHEPTFTTILGGVSELQPKAGSLYITGVSVEARSEHTTEWENNCQDVTFARVTGLDSYRVTFSIGSARHTVALRSTTSVVDFLEANGGGAVYLDITGLPHRVWAPLLKCIRSRQEPAFCVYVEPGDYQFSQAPTEVAIFDLSERTEGIEPLPGYVSFAAATDDAPLFVPLLGFEGPRFAYMLETVQPRREDIFPIVGVPGFRPEYPFYTYAGNRIQLWETRSWANVRFAAANCPFSLYHVLDGLSQANQLRRMVVAPIGTKPHALGAILYYLDHSRTTELLYDHPVRKKKRTLGTSRVCVYDLSLLPRIGLGPLTSE